MPNGIIDIDKIASRKSRPLNENGLLGHKHPVTQNYYLKVLLLILLAPTTPFKYPCCNIIQDSTFNYHPPLQAIFRGIQICRLACTDVSLRNLARKTAKYACIDKNHDAWTFAQLRIPLPSWIGSNHSANKEESWWDCAGRIFEVVARANLALRKHKKSFSYNIFLFRCSRHIFRIRDLQALDRRLAA